jgi:hypothetical protein
MTLDLSDVQRHPFGAADHEQGPQAGDTQLASGGALPFLMGVTVPSGRELLFLSGHTPPSSTARPRPRASKRSGIPTGKPSAHSKNCNSPSRVSGSQ